MLPVTYIRHTKPWLHYELPDFLPYELFQEARSIAFSRLDFSTPEKKSQIDLSLSGTPFVTWHENLYAYFCSLLEVQIIKPVTVKFQFTNYNNSDDSKRYDGGIHTDGFDKQISCLIPLSDTGSGTMLYDTNRRFIKQIEWKPNTAFLFANKPTHFHSVGLANNTSRCMLNAIYYPKGYRPIHEKTYNVIDTKEHHKYG